MWISVTNSLFFLADVGKEEEKGKGIEGSDEEKLCPYVVERRARVTKAEWKEN